MIYCLTETVVYRWYHRHFWEAAEKRYLRTDIQEIPPLPIGDGETSYSQKQARHLAIAKYFQGDWSDPVSCIFYLFLSYILPLSNHI